MYEWKDKDTGARLDLTPWGDGPDDHLEVEFVSDGGYRPSGMGGLTLPRAEARRLARALLEWCGPEGNDLACQIQLTAPGLGAPATSNTLAAVNDLVLTEDDGTRLTAVVANDVLKIAVGRSGSSLPPWEFCADRAQGQALKRLLDAWLSPDKWEGA